MAKVLDIAMDNQLQECVDIKASLEAVEYFKGIDVDRLAGFFTLKKLFVGDILFREGDDADSIAFIVSGRLEVKKQTEFPGKYFVLSILGKGSFIGEKAIIGKGLMLRTATVTALEETCLAVLKKDAFEEIFERSPDIAAGLLRALLYELSSRLNGANERMAALF
ncbi:MAG: Crp/Fnr family transcriptional regulator [Dissulfurimicrobium sp.]|uniref:Crp/Fnr family transcriptional regulator n=1 Tax=Dissulfurimicrobium sp. TaxID=2022436 RepID=UPI00404A0CAA